MGIKNAVNIYFNIVFNTIPRSFVLLLQISKQSIFS